MKKLLFMSAIALCGLSNAQISKGNWVIGGNTGMGFNNSTTKIKSNGTSNDGPKISTFSVTPSLGYFVIDGLAVGIDLGYTNTVYKELDMKQTTSMFSVMPNATYYFQTGGKFFPFLGAGIGYGSSKTKYNFNQFNDEGFPDPLISPNTELKADGLAWKVKGGVTYMATESLGLNLGVSYEQFSSKKNYNNVNAKTIAKTFGVNLGVSFFLKCNKEVKDTPN